MKSCHRKWIISSSFLLFYFCTNAQDQRAFNQNASRSNHTRLSFTLAPTFSVNANSKDTLSFRGTGAGFRMGADYYFGALGISLVSGFSTSSVDETKVNDFLRSFPVQGNELVIQKSRQQNSYLLIGPTVRFGTTVEVFAHAQGGLFFNNNGVINLQQKGSLRSAYRNEQGAGNINAGLIAGAGINYGTASPWTFGVTFDYLATRAQINNYDVRRGGGVEPLRLSTTVSDVMFGLAARYHLPIDIGQSRKKHVGNVKYEDIGARTGQANERRVLPTVNKREMQNGQSGTVNNSERCGPVTKRITRPDGSVEEMSFACAADAAAYENGGVIETPTDHIQTKKIVHRDLAARNLIAGRLSWTNTSGIGIVTNETIAQTSSDRQTQQTSFGSFVRLSTREAGSGIATGRRQYQPFFTEGNGNVCNPCLATAKMSSVSNNPLYAGNNNAGTNPLHKSMASNDQADGGLAGITISLVETSNNQVIAQTYSEVDGRFFFAGVPDGEYRLHVDGQLVVTKQYDITLSRAADLAAAIEATDVPVTMVTEVVREDQPQARAGVSTSRSNIRNRSIRIVEADLDGDGEMESLQVRTEQEPGSLRDISKSVNRTNNNREKKIIIGEEGMRIRKRPEMLRSAAVASSKPISSMTLLTDAGRLTVTATYADGKQEDISDKVMTQESALGVRTSEITVADTDDDGIADAVIKTKTKSNQSNDRHDADDDGIWSPRSNFTLIPVVIGNLNNDGSTTNKESRNKIKGHFQDGDIPGQQRTANPIAGVEINLNGPGGTTRSAQTTDNGEMEFTKLAPGDYTIKMAQTVQIFNESAISLSTEAASVNDHNSSRSNKSGSVIEKPDNDGSPSEAFTRNVSTSRSNIRNLLSALDQAEDQLVADTKSSRAIINTSRSNIKSQRIAAYELQDAIEQSFTDASRPARINQRLSVLNESVQALLDNLENLGPAYSSISNVLKTRHDTVKNSINNVR